MAVSYERKLGAVVCEVREELSGPGAWCQGTYEGWFGSHCILGGFEERRGRLEGLFGRGVIEDAVQAVQDRLPGKVGIPEWNDRMFRTQDQVIRTLWEIECDLGPEDHVLCDHPGSPTWQGVKGAPSGGTAMAGGGSFGGTSSGGGIRGAIGGRLARTPAAWKVGAMFAGTGLLLAVIAPVLFVVCLVATVLGVGGAVAVRQHRRRLDCLEVVEEPTGVGATSCITVVEEPAPEVPRPVARPRRRELEPVAVSRPTRAPVAAPVAAAPVREPFAPRTGERYDEPVRVGSQRATSAALGASQVDSPVRFAPAARADVSWRMWRPGRRRDEELVEVPSGPTGADLTSARRDYRDPDATDTQREIARVFLEREGADMAVEERERVIARIGVRPAPSAENLTPWIVALPLALEAPRVERGPSAAEVMASWNVAPDPEAVPVR